MFFEGSAVCLSAWGFRNQVSESNWKSVLKWVWLNHMIICETDGWWIFESSAQTLWMKLEIVVSLRDPESDEGQIWSFSFTFNLSVSRGWSSSSSSRLVYSNSGLLLCCCFSSFWTSQHSFLHLSLLSMHLNLIDMIWNPVSAVIKHHSCKALLKTYVLWN